MSHNNEHRSYTIFNISEIGLIDFSQVLEDSAETLRKSNDNTKTLVKWDTESTPASVQALTTSEGVYNNEEIFQIMNTASWKSPEPSME